MIIEEADFDFGSDDDSSFEGNNSISDCSINSFFSIDDSEVEAMPKKFATPTSKKVPSKGEKPKKSTADTEVKTCRSVSSSVKIELPYLVTTYKDGLNYRLALDIHLLSGTCPRDVAVSIENGDTVLIDYILPDTMFSTARIHRSGVDVGEDRLAKFEEEVLSLRQRNKATQERRFKSRFSIKLSQKVEDRFYKPKKGKAINVNLYDLDSSNVDFQKISGQTVAILHVNMTAQEKLVDYDHNDEVDFEIYATDYSVKAGGDSASKKRKSGAGTDSMDTGASPIPE